MEEAVCEDVLHKDDNARLLLFYLNQKAYAGAEETLVPVVDLSGICFWREEEWH